MTLRKFSLLLLFFSSSAYAADNNCSTVKNLAADLGPVHNQQDLSWCYAFTAADMISQKMQKDGSLKKGERIHPLQVAADYHIDEGRDPGSSQDKAGVPGSVFNTVNKNANLNNYKLCKETDLGPDTGPNAPLFKQSSTNAMKFFKDVVNKDRFQDSCKVTDRNLEKLNQVSTGIQNVSQKTWVDALNATCSTPAPHLDWFYNWDANRGKELRGKDPVPANPEAAKSMTDTLNYALDHGSMAGIAYIPNFMEKNPSSDKTFHWSSVVGREKARDGQCYYLIRNSWGTDCQQYKNPSQCHNGYIWVKSEDLTQNTSTVQYIK